MKTTSQRIAELSPEKLALLTERLKLRTAAKAVATVRRRADLNAYPMSFSQRRLWFLSQLGRTSGFYNIAAAVKLTGSLDVRLLERSFAELLRRHEILRARFVTRDGEPVQEIRETSVFMIQVVEDSSPDGSSNGDFFQSRARVEAGRPFDLERDLLVRATLFRQGQDRSVLLLVMHHIVADGWSVGVFIRELVEIYQSLAARAPLKLPDLPIQYADFAAWQNAWLEGPAAQSQLAAWKERLAGMPQVLEFPLDRQRPAVQTFVGDHVRLSVAAPAARRLKAFADEESATLFMAYLAAYELLLHRITGQEDFGVGIPVAQRSLPETQDLMGFLVNTVVIRAGFGGDPSFRQILRNVRGTTLSAFENQDVPLEKVVDSIVTRRDISYSPLFQAMFDLQRSPLRTVRMPGLAMEPVELDIDTSKTDLLLILEEKGDAVEGYFEYNTDLFLRSSVEAWVEIFSTLLEEVLRRPDTPISELDILPARHRHLVVDEWNRTARDYPQGSLSELFESQVAKAPEAIALDFDGVQVSYAELNIRANLLARRLRTLGVGPDVLVGVFTERSVDMVVAILGALKAGGAYLPLDLEFPQERLSFMLEDGQAPVVITQRHLRDRLPATAAVVLCLEDDAAVWQDSDGANLEHVSTRENLAYVMFTSGSTGRPKGVSIPQKAVVRLVCNTNYVEIEPTDRIAQASNVSFDAATFEIWGALLNGGRLVGVPREVVLSAARLEGVLRDRKITMMVLTTALFNHIARELPGAFRTLKVLMFGGDSGDPESVRLVLQQGPPGKLINVYGPTESTTFATTHLVNHLDSRARTVPIGRILANTTVYVLDRHLRPVPIGVIGELFIGGDGLARDYMHRPELTAEKFLPDPYGMVPGGRLYRTGDLVRTMADGVIEFVSRRDFQVKIRGFRIEPGEVEAVLASHPGVKAVCVMARQDQPGDKRLVAYVVPTSPGGAPVDVLRRFLGEKLPQYMVPAAFVQLSELPLNPNGKVERDKLPAPETSDLRSDAGHAPPSTPLEEFLANQWKDVLGLKDVGVHDNFFNLGGDSLKGAVLMNRLQQEFAETAHVSAIFLAPTIAELAMYINAYYSDAVQRRFGVESVSETRYVDIIKTSVSATRIELDNFSRFRQLIPPLRPRGDASSARDKNPRAVFVLSPPRSGSTLFRVMLAGHPALFAPPELDLLSFNTLRDRREALATSYSLWLDATIRALMEAEHCDASRARELMEECERKNLTIKEFYRFLQDRIGGRLLVDKTPTYPLDMEILRRAEEDFAEPLYVHLTRHPYGIVYSFIEAKLDQNFFRHQQPFTRQELAELIWTVSQENILEFLKGIPHQRQYRLRFEDLLRNPAHHMHDLCEFLGVDYDPRVLEPYEGGRMADGVDPRSQMVGDFKFYLHKGINPKSIDRWKSFHTKDFLSPQTWEVAESLGYHRNGNGNGKPHRNGLTAIPRVPREGELALSFAQLRLWFLEQLEPGSPLYNVPSAVRLEGRLDADALEKSLRDIIRRHESLRTIFPSEEGIPTQHIVSETAFSLICEDVAADNAQSAYEEALRRVRREASIPFDLVHGPLFRAKILRLDETDHILVITMHHIVSDGWSVGLLIHELVDLYLAHSSGTPSRLNELPVQYADFAAWQHTWLNADLVRHQLGYWQDTLKGMATVLELPTDRPRPAVQTSRGARLSLMILNADFGSLRELWKGESATPYMTLLSAFLILLHRYSGQEDLSVGTPVANRTRTELEPLIGFFANTVVLRNDLSGNPTFRNLLDRVRMTCQGAFDHQEIPFEKIVDALQPERDLSRSALFQVMFSYAKSGMPSVEIPGMTLRPVEVESGTAKFELTLEVTETARGFRCIFEYNTDLFDEETLRRMAGHFQKILKEVAHDPDRPIREIPLLSDDECRMLLSDWNDKRCPFPPEATFPALFQAQVERTPDAPAVFYEGSVLSYRELNSRANRLARHLQDLGVGPEKLVGVYLERSPEMIVAIVGIWKAGGAYVAMDPAHPTDRLELIAQDAGLSAVVTAGPKLPAGSYEVVRLDDRLDGSDSEPNPRSTVVGENLAYLIYTSGSTGRPKAVMIQHRSMVNLWLGLEDSVYSHHRGRALRTSLNAPLVFDASVQELVTLLSGHCLCILPAEIRGDGAALVSYIRNARLDVLDCVPSQLKLMLASGLLEDRAPWVPAVLLPGGEAIDETTWSTLARIAVTDAFNMYGPTECTVDSTICRCREVVGQASIGRPIVNVQHYVLDETMKPVPVGVAGELYVAGEGLSRGYHRRPEMTAERFVPNPFSAVAGERMYRTGDRVRYLPDGNIVFLERVDTQLKIRGFRIEPGEIESLLEQHPRIRQAVVVAREEVGGDRRLAAYYVPDDGPPPAVGELREHLKAKLPDYMIPSSFVLLERIPLTASGKVDRRALPAPPETRPDLGTDVVLPRNRAEQELVRIWKQVLRVQEMGIRDNFFELGGDSILAIQTIALAQQAGVRVSPKQLFQNPTVEGLASVADVEPAVNAEQGVVTGTVPLTPIQRWFFEQDFAEPHHWNQSVFVEFQDRADAEALRLAVEGILRHHDALRLRYRRTGTGWLQEIAPPDAGVPFEIVRLESVDDRERLAVQEDHLRRIQSSLSLEDGPLLRVVYFDAGPKLPPRLLIVVHHLAVDGVSWRILLEDLQFLYLQALAGNGLDLPPKTTSFKAWAEKLETLAASEALAGEAEFWTSQIPATVHPVPLDTNEGRTTEGSAARATGSFDESSTRALVQEVPAAYGTQIQEVLLTALAKTFGRWTGQRTLLVDLEGHGREDLFEGVDVGRTVGWFTTLYPVLLDLRGKAGLGGELTAVKEQLRQIPRNGIGYGILRYVSSRSEAEVLRKRHRDPEVAFNYLGQFDQAVAATPHFRALGEGGGMERSPASHRSHLLEFSAKILGGRLLVECGYSEKRHTRATAEKLVRDFLEELQGIVAHCRTRKTSTYTPSDFRDVALSQEDVDQMMEELGEDSSDSHGA